MLGLDADITHSTAHVRRHRSPAAGAPEVRAPRGLPCRRSAERSGHLRPRRRRSRGLLGRAGRDAGVDRPVRARARLEAAARAVVRRRQAQRVGQLRRPPHPHRAAQQGRADLRGRARRPPHAHLLGPLRRRQSVRQRAPLARREEGRPRRDLPADDPRSGDRDARLRAHRRDPLGGVRRLLPRVAARPDQRLAVQGPHHLRRRLPSRPGRAAQAQRRQGARGDAVDRARRRRAAPARRRRAARRSPR